MNILHAILIVLGGGFSAFVLDFIFIVILIKLGFFKNDMLGLAGLLFIFPVIFGLYGLVISVCGVFINSLPVLLLISLALCFHFSYSAIKNVWKTYYRAKHFDRKNFVLDILMVGSDFVIFPLVSVLVWQLSNKFLFSNE